MGNPYSDNYGTPGPAVALGPTQVGGNNGYWYSGNFACMPFSLLANSGMSFSGNSQPPAYNPTLPYGESGDSGGGKDSLTFSVEKPAFVVPAPKFDVETKPVAPQVSATPVKELASLGLDTPDKTFEFETKPAPPTGWQTKRRTYGRF
jgi:hypothetical protein